MKRHAEDDNDTRMQTPEVKRQRSHTERNVTHSRRHDERRDYSDNPQPWRTESYSNSRCNSNNRRADRDTPTPHERRASSYTRRPAAPVSHHEPKPSLSTASASSSSGVKLLSEEKETDPHRLAQRQKQIDYGKNTIGYDRYCAEVPRHQRRRLVHPMTPDKTLNVGKKAFDGMVRKWRQALHKYDPPELQNIAEEVASSATLATGASHAIAGGDGDGGDISDLDPERSPMLAANSTPSLSIYENFEEGDMDDDDDLL